MVGNVEQALGAAQGWMLDVDLVVVVLGAAAALEELVDLGAALPEVPVIVVSEEEAIRAEAVARGCAAAFSAADLTSDAALAVVEGVLSRHDARTAWAARFTLIRTLFAALDVGVIVVLPSGRVIAANLLAHELLGMTRAELLYRRLDLTLLTEAGTPIPAAEGPVHEVLVTGRPSEPLQCRLRLPSGREPRFELRARPVSSPKGPGTTGAVLTVRDISEQQAVQQALIAAERRDSLLLEHAAEGYLVLDEHGTVVEASATLNRYYPSERLIGSDAALFLHEQERERAAKMFASARDSAGVPMRAELRIVDAKGEGRWVELTMTNRLAEPSIGGIVVNLGEITERKLAEESMAQLSAIVEFSEDSIIAESLGGTIISWNPASARLYGYSAEEALGRSSVELVVPEARRAELLESREAIRRGERVERRDSVRVRKDGSQVVVSVHVSPVYDANGILVGTSTIARDVSERRRLEEERWLFEERFRIGFERGAIGMAMLDLRRRFTRVNRALCTMLGRQEEELIGHVVESFVHPLEVELAIQASSAQVSGDVDMYHGERRYVRKDGGDVWATVDSTVVRGPDAAPLYVFTQFQDITARKRSEQALAHQALHDSLTGLPNRALLGDRLGQAIERGSRNVSQIALLFLDLDRFKLVNDGLGHAAGDRLLVAIAERLSAGVRRSDTVARFGGDEFILMREDVDATEAVELGDQVIALFAEPFVLDDAELHVSASCGVVLVAGETSDRRGAARRRRRDVPRRRRGGGRDRAVQPRAPPMRRRPALRLGARPLLRHRAPRVPRRLSADRRDGHRPPRRRRGPGALGATGVGVAHPDRVHPRRRGDGPHRRHRRLRPP